MDLIVVDGDCRELWNMSELERLLDAQRDAVWFFDDAVLREHHFNVYGAARVPLGTSVEKGILLTKMQSGVMGYHREMIRHTSSCKYWMIVVLDENNDIFRKQYCAGFDSALAGTSVRYGILFDDSSTLQETAEAKKEIVDGRPYCIIATKTSQELAERMETVLSDYMEGWRFSCHVGLEEDAYKYADVILLVGRTEEDYLIPPTNVNTGRIRIWIEMQKGNMSHRVVQERAERIIERMNDTGWNLGSLKERVFGSCLDYEILLAAFHKGEISIETLRTDDRFVIWDSYGLPLPDKAYRDAKKAESFLREQCCLTDIFEERNGNYYAL